MSMFGYTNKGYRLYEYKNKYQIYESYSEIFSVILCSGDSHYLPNFNSENSIKSLFQNVPNISIVVLIMGVYK